MIRSKRTRWAGHIEWGRRNAKQILVGKPEEKISLRRPSYRWVFNTETDLGRERMGWYSQDWSGSG
jgi:phage protein U